MVKTLSDAILSQTLGIKHNLLQFLKVGLNGDTSCMVHVPCNMGYHVNSPKMLLIQIFFMQHVLTIGVGRGGGGGGGRPPQEKNHKCNNLKGKITINVTLILFEGTGKTIPLNSIIECSILSDFKMRNVIIWH